MVAWRGSGCGSASAAVAGSSSAVEHRRGVGRGVHISAVLLQQVDSAAGRTVAAGG